jgi:uroporphyrinogen-III decarboxylase
MMASPGMITSFDYLSDFLRGTIATSTDLYDYPDEIEEFLDEQVQISMQVLRNFPYPPRRLQFMPLHKGMDKFLSDEHYERFYWKYLTQWVQTLISLGVTPILYTEGHYATRLKYLQQLPPGKCIVHFENTDIALAKRELSGIACISGNFPAYMLSHATVPEVVEQTKRLLDVCAPGGGYIFDFDGGLYASKRENVEAVFDTVKEYGKY